MKPYQLCARLLCSMNAGKHSEAKMSKNGKGGVYNKNKRRPTKPFHADCMSKGQITLDHK